MKKKILLATYGGVHVRAIKPIFDSLKSLGFTVIALPLTTASLSLPKSKNILHLDDFIPPEKQARINYYGEKFVDTKSLIQLPIQDSIHYIGWSILDLVEKYGEIEALNKFKTNGRKCFEQTSIAQHILETLNPDAVITTNSPRLEFALNQVANNKGLPSFVINTDPLGTNNINTLVTQSFTSTIYTLSNVAKNNLVKHGAKANNILVTGLPHYDYLKLIDYKTERLNGRNKIGLINEEKIVTWFTAQKTAVDNFPHEIFEEFLQELESICKFKLVVRTHPSDTYKVRSLHANHLSLIESIAASDIILTVGSTIVVESLMLNKNIIFMDFGEKSNQRLPFHKTDYIHNIIKPINDDQSLNKEVIKNAIKLALNSEKSTEHNTNSLTANLGMATTLISKDIIKKLA